MFSNLISVSGGAVVTLVVLVVRLGTLQNVLVSGDNVYCWDYQECAGDDISGYYYTDCSGFMGCMAANITDFYNLDCRGAYGCYLADIKSQGDADYATHCDGTMGCQQATADAGGRILYARGLGGFHQGYATNYEAYGIHGAAGLQSGMIDSGDTDEVTIYLDGYLAAYDATILCRDGSYCWIYCTENANCDSANITCYGDDDDNNCYCESEYCPSLNFYGSDSSSSAVTANDIKEEFLSQRALGRKERIHQITQEYKGISDKDLEQKVRETSYKEFAKKNGLNQDLKAYDDHYDGNNKGQFSHVSSFSEWRASSSASSSAWLNVAYVMAGLAAGIVGTLAIDKVRQCCNADNQKGYQYQTI